MTENWQPLLQGSDEHAARTILSILDSAVGSRLKIGANSGLASGHAGLLLLEHYTEHGRLNITTVASLLRAIEHERLGVGLFSGIAGVGWALAHALGSPKEISPPVEPSSDFCAAGNDYEDIASAMLVDPSLVDDILIQVDDALARFLVASREPFELDLISGTVGLGVYALERMRSGRAEGLLQAVVDQLVQAAEIEDQKVRWFTPLDILRRRKSKHLMGFYDLGVAHGLPGIISVLASAKGVGVNVRSVDEVLPGAVNELLARVSSASTPSRLPTYVYSNGLAPAARLAWCYGDTGAAAVLLHAAQTCNRTDWMSKALELACTSVARGVASAPPEETGVFDASLCHGSAGIAHALNRMYQRTGEKTLSQASIEWFRRTIAFGNVPTLGVGGYSAFYPTEQGDEWRAEAGFLEGACGIALALKAAIGTRAPDWDSVLGLSAPLVASSGLTVDTTRANARG